MLTIPAAIACYHPILVFKIKKYVVAILRAAFAGTPGAANQEPIQSPWL